MEARIRRDYRHTKRKVFALSYLAFLTWNIPTTWWIWYSGKYATDDPYFLPLSYCSQTNEPQSVAHLLSSDMAFV